VHINPAIRQNAVNGKIMPFPLIKYHGLEFFANLGIADFGLRDCKYLKVCLALEPENINRKTE